jgi:hypothetical protein
VSGVANASVDSSLVSLVYGPSVKTGAAAVLAGAAQELEFPKAVASRREVWDMELAVAIGRAALK